MPIDIGGDRRILAGVLRPTSALVNVAIRDSGIALRKIGVNIIGVLRGGEMLTPAPEVVLLEGDRLIIVAPEASLHQVRTDLDPW